MSKSKISLSHYAMVDDERRLVAGAWRTADGRVGFAGTNPFDGGCKNLFAASEVTAKNYLQETYAVSWMQGSTLNFDMAKVRIAAEKYHIETI